MTLIDRLASQALVHILSGLAGFESSMNIPLDLLKDDIIQTRAMVLQKYAFKNQLPLKELYLSINCIKVDCAPISNCCDSDESIDPAIPHFEIPLIFFSAGPEAIEYIGSIDKKIKFKVYTSPSIFKHNKHLMHRKKRPYVYISTTPNKNNHLDGYIFDAPLLETLSISAIFKDIRDLDEFLCCDFDLDNLNNLSWIDTEVVDTVVNKYLKYYRQLYPQPQLNDQVPR